MRVIESKDELPDPISFSLWALESLERRIAPLQRAARRHRERIRDWMADNHVRGIVMPGVACYLARAPTRRQFNYARMRKEFPEAYDWLIMQGLIKLIPPSHPFQLRVKLHATQGAEDTE